MLGGNSSVEDTQGGPTTNSLIKDDATATAAAAATTTDSVVGSLPPPHWDEEEDESIEDDTKVLLRVWLNERAAPVLLPYATITIGNILELLANQMALLVEQRGDTANAAYVSCLYQMEIERLKFMVTSYLKCRIHKVPSFERGWRGGEREKLERTHFTLVGRSRTIGYTGGTPIDRLSLAGPRRIIFNHFIKSKKRPCRPPSYGTGRLP